MPIRARAVFSDGYTTTYPCENDKLTWRELSREAAHWGELRTGHPYTAADVESVRILEDDNETAS